MISRLTSLTGPFPNRSALTWCIDWGDFKDPVLHMISACNIFYMLYTDNTMCCAREVYVWWIFNVMWSSPIKTVDYFISRLTKYQNYFIKINQIITLTDSHLWSKPAVIQRRQRSRYIRLTHFVCIIVESQVMDNRPYKLEQESFRSMLCSFPAGVCKKKLFVSIFFYFRN